MKRKIALFLALVMLAAVSVIALPAMAEGEEPSEADKEAARKVAELIDAIYVQQRTETTDADCAAAKAAWDALTDLQKSLVEGEEADPDYFGRDTGDASKDDPRNADGIGENELLVVSFGTSFNDSRAEDIGGIEAALEKAFPEWAVRRAFTAQIIINHVQARDGEFIDNMDQALERAVANGVKNLVIQPTHLMHGAEYDELVEAVTKYADKFAAITVAEPLLGQVGADAAAVNNDKQTVAEAVVAAAVADGGFSSFHAAEKDGTAIVLMGHGTAHSAKVTYSQMQTMMRELGYKNVFIGTVEGEPEETACEEVIKAVHEAGYGGPAGPGGRGPGPGSAPGSPHPAPAPDPYRRGPGPGLLLPVSGQPGSADGLRGGAGLFLPTPRRLFAGGGSGAHPARRLPGAPCPGSVRERAHAPKRP